MFKIFEFRIRDGITQSVERYAKENNKYFGELYNKDEQYIYIYIYIQYLDANNSYSGVMSQELTVKNFIWVDPNSNCFSNEKYGKYTKGYLLDADIYYPKHLRYF